MMRIIGLIFFFLVLFLLFVLAYLNSEIIHFDYLLSQAELPLSLLLLVCFLAGVALATLSYSGLIFSLKRKINKLTSVKRHS